MKRFRFLLGIIFVVMLSALISSCTSEDWEELFHKSSIIQDETEYITISHNIGLGVDSIASNIIKGDLNHTENLFMIVTATASKSGYYIREEDLDSKVVSVSPMKCWVSDESYWKYNLHQTCTITFDDSLSLDVSILTNHKKFAYLDKLYNMPTDSVTEVKVSRLKHFYVQNEDYTSVNKDEIETQYWLEIVFTEINVDNPKTSSLNVYTTVLRKLL